MYSYKQCIIRFLFVSIPIISIVINPSVIFAKPVAKSAAQSQIKIDTNNFKKERTRRVNLRLNSRKRSNQAERIRKSARKIYDWREINPLEADRVIKLIGLALVGATVKSHMGNY